MESRFCLILCTFVVALPAAIAVGQELQPEAATSTEPNRSSFDQLFSGALAKVSAFSDALPSTSDATEATATDSAGATADTSSAAPAAVIYVRVSRDYLAPRFERQVDRQKPLTDEILGTRIEGTSHTQGQTRLRLLPSTDSLRAEIVFAGTCRSESRGYNGPAVLQIEGNSTFRATKLLVLDESGFTTSPTRADANTRQRATDISTRRNGLLSGLVERVARRRINESQAEADRIASDHTAERVAQDLDTRLDTAVGTFTDRLFAAAGVKPTEIAGLATTPDGQPLKIHFRSTDSHIELAMAANECAWEELEKDLPAIAGNPHVAVRVHRTFVTHVAANSHKSPAVARFLSTGLQSHLTQQTAALLESEAETSKGQPTWSFNLNWLSLDIPAADLSHLASAQ